MNEGDNHVNAQIVEAVGVAIPPVSPPAELEMLVLAAVEREAAAKTSAGDRRRLRWPRLLPAFAGAAAVAAAVVVSLMSLGGGETGSLDLTTVLQAPVGPAAASVEVRKTGIGRVIAFESDSLPILPKGDYYELWFVAPDDRPTAPNRISAGTFHPDEDGRSRVRFTAAVDPALYPVLSVTAEPGDGDPRPTGPEVLRSAP
jgi:Anti-sigma-K factor rskA, C-terminal